MALLTALSLMLAAMAAAEVSEPAPPSNDARASAQHINTLPSTIEGTTVGATLEPNEASSGCSGSTSGSVWYTLRTPVHQRVAVDLAAGGALDGTIDVYHAVRSQLLSEGCQATNTKGHASLSFESSKNGVYYIRVAALSDSQRATFTLEVFLPTPPVEPPGPRLPAAGVNGHVDRIQNINAAYSLPMSAGVSYMISLANETEGGCVRGHLFAPGTRSFESGSALKSTGCGGFRLFTPGPGEGGIYNLEIPPTCPSLPSSASTCRSRRPGPPKRRQGSRSATTPAPADTSTGAACACCASTAWTSPATPTSRSSSAPPNPLTSTCSCGTKAAT